MIDLFSLIAHLCASCANAANTVPGAAGALGGAAGALGGLGGLTPLRDLYPPGATVNSDGSLSWPNDDGTTSTKALNGTITTTSPTGPTTTKYPGGATETTGTDGTRTVTDSRGRSTTWRTDETETSQDPGGPSTVGPFDGLDGDNEKIVGANDPNPMEDRNGNALVGFAGGVGAGLGMSAAKGIIGEAALGRFVEDRVIDGRLEGFELSKDAVHEHWNDHPEAGGETEDRGSEHPGEDDPPDATVPDASVGNTYPSEPGDAGAPAPTTGGESGAIDPPN